MGIKSSAAARIVLTVLVALLVGTSSAVADSCASTTDCTYQLNFANDTSSSGLGSLASYGSVELTRTNGQINFLVTLASGFKIFDAFGFNSSIATDPSSLNLTSSTSGFTTGSVALGSTQLDGFGTFEYVNNGPNGPPNGSTSLSFTVANSTAFTDVHQLVEGSGKVGSLFAAHVFNGSGTCDTTKYSCTGWIGTTASTSAVPEPSSYLWLMGAGFGLIVLVFERRRRKTA